MENRSIFIITAVGAFLGSVATIIGVMVENWSFIMGIVTVPEVKSGFWAGFAITIGLYLLLYGFWRLIVKPYIDKKNKVHEEKIDDLIIHVELLKECVDVFNTGKPKGIKNITNDIIVRIARNKKMSFEKVNRIIEKAMKMEEES